MINLDLAIVTTLGAVALKHKKPYCFPSQAHICKLLRDIHKITISRRTLNRRLAGLELDRFFVRVRRHRRAESGKIIFNTTLYKLKKKFFDFVGLLKRQTDRFFSLFRVPFLAQYHGPTSLGSSQPSSKATAFDGPPAERGGAVGAESSHPLRANLEKVRQLLKLFQKGS